MNELMNKCERMTTRKVSSGVVYRNKVKDKIIIKGSIPFISDLSSGVLKVLDRNNIKPVHNVS